LTGRSRFLVRRLAIVLVAMGLAGGSLERPDIDDSKLDAHLDDLRAQSQERLRLDQLRIQQIGDRLKLEGAPLCGKATGPLLGAAIARRHDFLYGHAKDAKDAVGLVDEVKVFAVSEGSPAASAGLQRGDLIVSIAGSRIHKTQEVFAELRDAPESEIEIGLVRDGNPLHVSLPYVESCGYGIFIRIDEGTRVRSHRNRTDIWVPTGLLQFALDDDEVAFSIAHQLGHQISGTAMSGDTEDEVEADRIALFMAARAGYDVSKAAAYWDRLAASEPGLIPDDGDQHTSMAKRAPEIRKTVAEIQQRIAERAGLDPNP